MFKIKRKKVVFYSIFLNIILFIFRYSYCYEEGVNRVTKEIMFSLDVKDSIEIITDVENIDFGEILRGSTGIYKGTGKIKIVTGIEAQYATANFKNPVEEDGKIKGKIYYIQNQEEKKRNGLEFQEEKMEMEVYFHELENKYPLVEENNEKRGEIILTAEIRGVDSEVKLGRYEGIMEIEVIIVNRNEGENK